MPGTARRKSFLLGVGAQKAGTTWLHDYLSNHENVDLGFRKEYHVFDALSSRNNGFFETHLRRAEDLLAELQNRLDTDDNLLISPGGRRQRTFKLVDFLYDFNNYFDYFDSLLARDFVALTGDITPSYSGLSADIFMVVKNGLAARGMTPKVVFLMRDPVDRFISSAQMRSGRKRHAIDEAKFEEIVRRRYRTENSEDRGRYDQTIRNLEAVFDKSEIYYEFYERLFNAASIAKLCAFLGIEAKQAELDNRINQAKRKYPVSDEIRLEIRSHFSPVYDFLYARYSKPFIDSIWKSYA